MISVFVLLLDRARWIRWIKRLSWIFGDASVATHMLILKVHLRGRNEASHTSMIHHIRHFFVYRFYPTSTWLVNATSVHIKWGSSALFHLHALLLRWLCWLISWCIGFLIFAIIKLLLLILILFPCQWLSSVFIFHTLCSIFEDSSLIHCAIIFLEKFCNIELFSPRWLSNIIWIRVGCMFDLFKYFFDNLNIVFDGFVWFKGLQVYLLSLLYLCITYANSVAFLLLLARVITFLPEDLFDLLFVIVWDLI